MVGTVGLLLLVAPPRHLPALGSVVLQRTPSAQLAAGGGQAVSHPPTPLGGASALPPARPACDTARPQVKNDLFGEKLKQSMRDEGIDVSGIITDVHKDAPSTGVALITITITGRGGGGGGITPEIAPADKLPRKAKR